MKKYAKENKHVKFATEEEMKEVREEEDSDLSEEFEEVKGEKFYKLIKPTADSNKKDPSQDPNYIIPKVDSKTLKQVKELEKKDAELAEKLKAMKPNKGVKMVEYNEWGLPADGTDYSKFFRFDETLPSDIVVKPPAEYQYPHLTVDEDKEYKDLTEEEKEIRDQLMREDEKEDEENVEQLEDDFVLKANGGEPALVEPGKKTKAKDKKQSKNEDELDKVMKEYDDDDMKDTKPGKKHEEKDEDEKMVDMDEDEYEDIDDEDEEVEEIELEGKLSKDQIDKVIDEYMSEGHIQEAISKQEQLLHEVVGDESEDEDEGGKAKRKRLRLIEEKKIDKVVQDTPEERKKFVGKLISC